MYKGRFAPFPTGPLHFGSLVTALSSDLDARSAGRQWMRRIEDLDTPRNVAGADGNILRTPECFGLEWDGPAVYRSRRSEAYQLAFTGIYPGTCRRGVKEAQKPPAWRVGVRDAEITFEGRLPGPQRQDLGHHVGDFIVLRSDGVFAYQLAEVVDDAALGIADVVRGADLLDSAGRQIIPALNTVEPSAELRGALRFPG